ncbi:MAG: hypothetical protein KY434_06215 [Actinobacteria bacterium]|nr:hypothetical protein [Actinomycetota bacterium]
MTRSTSAAPKEEAAEGQGTIARLQGEAGNRAVGALLQRVKVQRHAPGAALPDEEQLVAEVDQALATSEVAPAPGGAGTPATAGGTEPAPAGGAPDTAAAGPAPEGATPAPTGGTEAEPAQAPPARTGTEVEQRAATEAGTAYNTELAGAGGGRAMSLAGAQAILQGAFGDVHTIVPGNIEILNGRPALWAKYDEVCIAAGIINPDTGVLWASGDAQAASPGLEGFAWEGVVYVNQNTPLVTATAHEILHNNTAAGFRAAVGETINEGATEYLAKKALGAAGVATPSSATAYPTEVAIMEALIGFIGESALIGAYFGGADSLIQAYESARGEMGSWAAFKAATETNDITQVTPLLTRHPAVDDRNLVPSDTAVA